MISMLSSDMSYTANGVEPDQLASEKLADQDPHCFLRYLYLNTLLLESFESIV